MDPLCLWEPSPGTSQQIRAAPIWLSLPLPSPTLLQGILPWGRRCWVALGDPRECTGGRDLPGVYLLGPALRGPELYEAADAAASLRAAAIKLAGGSEVIPTALKWPKPVVCDGN